MAHIADIFSPNCGAIPSKKVSGSCLTAADDDPCQVCVEWSSPWYFLNVKWLNKLDTRFNTAGEHSMIMLSSLQSESVEGTEWLMSFVQDFKLRFWTLLAGSFRHFGPGLAMSILDPKITFSDTEAGLASSQSQEIVKSDGAPFSAFDLRRLQVNFASWHTRHVQMFAVRKQLIEVFWCSENFLNHSQQVKIVDYASFDFLSVEAGLLKSTKDILAFKFSA